MSREEPCSHGYRWCVDEQFGPDGHRQHRSVTYAADAPLPVVLLGDGPVVLLVGNVALDLADAEILRRVLGEVLGEVHGRWWRLLRPLRAVARWLGNGLLTFAG